MYINTATVSESLEHHVSKIAGTGKMFSQMISLLLPPQWMRSWMGLDAFSATVIVWFVCLWVLLVSCLIREYIRVKCSVRDLEQARFEAGITQ